MAQTDLAVASLDEKDRIAIQKGSVTRYFRAPKAHDSDFNSSGDSFMSASLILSLASETLIPEIGVAVTLSESAFRLLGETEMFAFVSGRQPAALSKSWFAIWATTVLRASRSTRSGLCRQAENPTTCREIHCFECYNQREGSNRNQALVKRSMFCAWSKRRTDSNKSSLSSCP